MQKDWRIRNLHGDSSAAKMRFRGSVLIREDFSFYGVQNGVIAKNRKCCYFGGRGIDKNSSGIRSKLRREDDPANCFEIGQCIGGLSSKN
jgi:hypothetical protein